jgi:uncharacterized protein (DUF427 family)
MPTATWNGRTIATSNDTVVVEGNHYFPVAALDKSLVKPSTTSTVCGWKGTCSYMTLVVDGKENKDAVWFYAEPKSAAAEIKDRVAFWKGVEVR